MTAVSPGSGAATWHGAVCLSARSAAKIAMATSNKPMLRILYRNLMVAPPVVRIAADSADILVAPQYPCDEPRRGPPELREGRTYREPRRPARRISRGGRRNHAL